MFSLDKTQRAKFEAWKKARPTKPEGAIGGRYVYMFAPTSLGTIVKVLDACTGEEIDLTDYEGW